MTAKKRKKRLKRQDSARCDDILARLAAVPEGYEVAVFLNTERVEICFDEQAFSEAASAVTITGLKDGKYSYSRPTIILNAALGDNNITQALVHEVQHLRHHLNGLGNPDRILSEEDHQLFRAVQEADAQAAAVDVTFKMKLKGDGKPYERTAAIGYEDMCRAYEKAYEADPQSIRDGRAKRAAFDAWFTKQSRVAHYDRNTVDVHTPFLENLRKKYSGHGLKPGRLKKEWIRKIGALSDVNYLDLPGQPDALDTARAALKKTRENQASIDTTEKKKTGSSPKP
ncbi:MAG: hypothetical protein EA357_03450 [Micavibrio sp.]|nr:MAG: hypothetical protein EA357_03450 [Micavibrio sp.]